MQHPYFSLKALRSVLLTSLAMCVFGVSSTVAAYTTTVANKLGASQHQHKKNLSKKFLRKKKPHKPSAPLIHFETWSSVDRWMTDLHTQDQFDKNELRQIFSQVRHIETARQLVRPAPIGKPKNWQAYRARFVENQRIEAGAAFWDRNQASLIRAEQEFGVPPEIIVGLIGVETIYGKTTGSFRAIDVLSTLAFDYPDLPNRVARQSFFQKELYQLFLWAREHNKPIFEIKSSYAGAIGIAQFMPSSLRQFAIDYDQDQNIDLRSSEADAIGSIANYLKKHGWDKSLPMVFPANLIQEKIEPAQLQTYLGAGLKASFNLAQLNQIVSSPELTEIPTQYRYGLIDLQNGDSPDEYWIVSDNFFAITHYNRSYFYAMSIIDLGKVIALSRQK